MKNIKLFILASSMIAFVSCSTTHAETIDEKSALDSQTRGEASQNDSSQKGGVTATIKPRDTVTAEGIGGGYRNT